MRQQASMERVDMSLPNDNEAIAIRAAVTS
jgi:hypothetical protein